MRVIGIDPGTRWLGWGIVDHRGNRVCHVGDGVLKLPADRPLSERLLAIELGLSEVIREFRPEVGSVETLFFHKDAQAAAKLGHARGVVLLALARAGIPVAEYSPARVKATVVGGGRADKLQVARMIRTVLGLELVPASDAADALALAITHTRRQGSAAAALGAGQRGAPRLAELLAAAKRARRSREALLGKARKIEARMAG